MTAIDRAWVLIDGVPRTAQTAQISVFDRGFLYGDSVFETLRTYAAEPFALEEHLDRLAQSAERVQIPLGIDRKALASEVRLAIQQAGFEESFIRVMLTRGRADLLGLDPSLADRPVRVVMVLPLDAPASELYDRGIGAITYRAQRTVDGTTAAGAKVSNYLTAVLAMHQARQQGALEALLVDARERVLEGATSNLFGVLSGALITPPEELGILPGITRAHLLRVAERVGIPASKRAITVDELWSFDELFISSSIRELLALVRIDGRTVGAGRPGPIFHQLLQAFRKEAKDSCLASAAKSA